MKSPQPEKSKPPVKVEQRGRILGIGGVFFESANRDQTREWYRSIWDSPTRARARCCRGANRMTRKKST